jgi:hypothetical protein
MTKFPRLLLALVTSGVLLLVGCSSEQPAQKTPSSDESVAVDPAPKILAEGSEALPAGTYTLDLDARGSGAEHFPNVTMTVPEGWTNIDGWGINSAEDNGDHWMGITFWDVDKVFAHPCQWKSRMIQPGPTAAGLASALAKQPLRHATEPADITVDGFHGAQLQWSVPADMAGEPLAGGGFDFSTCDEDVSVGDHPFKSWTAAAGSWAGERYHQGPGQVNRLWILDINGERLVVDAMYMPTTDAKDRKELFEVTESIRFETS